jgi:hypothetical protein
MARPSIPIPIQARRSVVTIIKVIVVTVAAKTTGRFGFLAVSNYRRRSGIPTTQNEAHTGRFVG